MVRSEQHSQQVWEDFWEKQSIEQVYQNSDRIVEQITKAGDVAGKWIMEIGAGSGRDSFKLAEMGARIILLDYAKNSLQLMQQISEKLDQKVDLVRGDAFHLPFKENSIDVIFHQGLLEHFTEPDGIVQQSFHALKVGGINVSDVPQKYHMYTAVKHILIWMKKWFAGWETEFSIGQLRSMHKRAGFDIYAVYGDWMRPSFVYRASREALKKIGLTLPQYPKSIPFFSKIRNALRQFFITKKIALYTFMDIGVVGIKRK
jgi:ubiquinone/menaquinone biosynthesis C-methylase UbiE